MDILDYIPTGHNNAIPRKELQRLTRMNDREIRKLIADTNKNAPDDVLIINMQDGMGYFRPAPDEKYLVRNWRMQMRSRANENDEGADAADRYLKAANKRKKKPVDELEANQISLFDYIK